MFTDFLNEDQMKALEAAIRMARSKHGIHRVPMSDGEAYAYRFNSEVVWHVEGADRANMAKGIVPLIRPTDCKVIPFDRRTAAQT
ncbi:hypothetical protein KKP04_09565 [Rhodomicrobium sp. Az07]|uniref:hypothetical protein n=1 Tax=Rhodomicrobium sp. Az07 TaxID=2839034 RepID=UPI001BE71515|nr:hypothetical protein [Rhodomicrobium sp. Az07]MBT3071116.1 hypothetical protein [Rhodomicrobium sp. Az07]